MPRVSKRNVANDPGPEATTRQPRKTVAQEKCSDDELALAPPAKKPRRSLAPKQLSNSGDSPPPAKSPQNKKANKSIRAKKEPSPDNEAKDGSAPPAKRSKVKQSVVSKDQRGESPEPNEPKKTTARAKKSRADEAGAKDGSPPPTKRGKRAKKEDSEPPQEEKKPRKRVAKKEASQTPGKRSRSARKEADDDDDSEPGEESVVKGTPPRKGKRAAGGAKAKKEDTPPSEQENIAEDAVKKSPLRKGKKAATNKADDFKKRAKGKAKSTDEQRDEADLNTTRGKENLRRNRKVKSYAEDSDEEDDEDEFFEKKPKPKKGTRSLAIPEDDSDSEDNYNPVESDSDESDASLSENVSESEPETASDSDNDSPRKKGKMANITKSRGKSVGNKSKSVISSLDNDDQLTKKKSSDSWPHLKYEFLQPDKIRDKYKRKPDDPDYDPKTVYVPKEFLDKQNPSMQQWWLLKSDHYDTVLFFKVGKFYELYHMDATVGVNELSLFYMKSDFARAGFPEVNHPKWSDILIEKGYKIARIEQTESSEMAAQRYEKISNPTKIEKLVTREICQKTTKGTRVYSPQDAESLIPTSRYLLAIIEKAVPKNNVSSYGVCFIDTSIGEFNLGQFEDDRCNSKLLTLLVHYPPAHVISERRNLSQTTLKILDNVLPGARKETLMKETEFWTPLKVLKHLQNGEYFKKGNDSDCSWPNGLLPFLNTDDDSKITPAKDKELAINALGGCLYLMKEYQLDYQLLTQSLFTTYTPPGFSDRSISKTKNTKFALNMVLDAMTINNLRILGNDGSLIKTLDHSSTAFGKRLLREWVCKPSCRKSVIKARQDAITELLDKPDIVREVRRKLGSLPDLERLLSKIHAQGNPAKLKHHPDSRAILFDSFLYSRKTIVDFINTLNGFEEVLKTIELFKDFKSPLIAQCTKLEPEGDFPDLEETLAHFRDAFDHEKAKLEGLIVFRPGVDEDFDALSSELADIKEALNVFLEKQKKHFGVNVKFCGLNYKRYQIEIPDSLVGKAGKEYEEVGSRKGFKKYYTNESRELLAREIEAEEQKKNIIEGSSRKLFTKFSEHYQQWTKACRNIAVLDCLISLSEYAKNHRTCIPTVYDDTDHEGISIDIKEGRHPCLATANFVPNDTSIACGDSAALIILTGPNMGGKSTLMRQAGLITIMAQIGCHVPAAECKLTLIDRIFTRLGANDDILAGQSTFLVELSETSTILQHATKYSLVLLDELGRGTSTYDGTAIAASVVEALTKINCRTLFSTHYHSLVEDYKTNNNVTLAHMACTVENDDEDEEDVTEENVTFLYKLSRGACPRSYGFNAARLAGLPANITKRAQEIATKLETEVNLRHKFTALCRVTDSKSIKSLLKTSINLIA